MKQAMASLSGSKKEEWISNISTRNVSERARDQEENRRLVVSFTLCLEGGILGT